MQKLIFILFFSLLLSSCSLLDPIVYKLPIQQGNIIDQEQVDKLRLDMSKEQVAFALGTPMVLDAFNADHWEYLYLLKNQDGDQIKKALKVHFKKGRLSAVISQDYKLNKVYPDSVTKDPSKEKAQPTTEGNN